MKLEEKDLQEIANSIKRYLSGSVQTVFKKEGFDSVTDGDIGFSFYHEYNSFKGNLKEPNSFSVKAYFLGNVSDKGVVNVQEEGTSNSFTL